MYLLKWNLISQIILKSHDCYIFCKVGDCKYVDFAWWWKFFCCLYYQEISAFADSSIDAKQWKKVKMVYNDWKKLNKIENGENGLKIGKNCEKTLKNCENCEKRWKTGNNGKKNAKNNFKNRWKTVKKLLIEIDTTWCKIVKRKCKKKGEKPMNQWKTVEN